MNREVLVIGIVLMVIETIFSSKWFFFSFGIGISFSSFFLSYFSFFQIFLFIFLIGLFFFIILNLLFKIDNRKKYLGRIETVSLIENDEIFLKIDNKIFKAVNYTSEILNIGDKVIISDFNENGLILKKFSNEDFVE